MDTYNKMRADYLMALMTEIPDLSPDELSNFGHILDRIAHTYQISCKELAISTHVKTIPTLVKTYIAVKRTEGLSINSLQNYARMLVYFFQTIMKCLEDMATVDISMYLYEFIYAQVSAYKKVNYV